jgi:ribonuclease VapC
MILDSSAIVALFLQEPGWEVLLDEMSGGQAGIGIGAPTLTETGIVLSARLQRDARPMLSRFLQEMDIEVLPFGENHWQEAMSAWRRFGKGRHPAALNFGDCLSYATAKLAGQPLLFVGDDFPATDIQAVTAW